jgi:hypothetical protein
MDYKKEIIHQLITKILKDLMKYSKINLITFITIMLIKHGYRNSIFSDKEWIMNQ